MEENKDKLVFSSVKSEKIVPQTPPKEAVDKAFHDEYIRQTSEIPVKEIKEAYESSLSNKPEQTIPVVQEPPEPIIVSQVKIVQPMGQVQKPQPIQQPNPQQVPLKTENEATKQSITQNVSVQQVQPQSPIQEAPVQSKEEKKSKTKEKHHMKKGTKIALIFSIILITTVITTFKMITHVNNPKVIVRRSLLSVGSEIKNIVKLNDKATIIGDNYNISSTITASLDSQVFKEEATTDEKMLEKLYLMNNLNNSKTTLSVIHDTINKKFFYNRQTIKNDKVIVDDKYLIENSTEYYFVKDFLETYINDGNNTYFETINDSENAIDNIEYLYKIILENIANCIDDDYYNVTNTTTYINDKTENVKKVSIKLDNIKIRKILNNLIKSLKKDKRAFNILNGVIDDFANYKITSKTKFLKNNETLTINFYTKGTLNRTKKYEVSKTGSKESSGFTYEIDNKKITILKDNKVKNYLKYKLSDTNIKIDIQNKNEKKIGSIVYDSTDTRKHFTYEYEDDTNNTSIDINYKITDKKSSSYKSNTKCIINIKKEDKNYLSGTISIDSKTTNKTEFQSNIKDVTFSSEITDEKYDELENLLKTRLKKEIS